MGQKDVGTNRRCSLHKALLHLSSYHQTLFSTLGMHRTSFLHQNSFSCCLSLCAGDRSQGPKHARHTPSYMSSCPPESPCDSLHIGERLAVFRGKGQTALQEGRDPEVIATWNHQSPSPAFSSFHLLNAFLLQTHSVSHQLYVDGWQRALKSETTPPPVTPVLVCWPLVKFFWWLHFFPITRTY